MPIRHYCVSSTNFRINRQTRMYRLSLTRETCWGDRLAWRLAQLYAFLPHTLGKISTKSFAFSSILFKVTWRNYGFSLANWFKHLSTKGWLSSQHPQTLRFFTRDVKNIKHHRHFPQGIERSNPHENYPHTRETIWEKLAELAAVTRGGYLSKFLSCTAGCPDEKWKHKS
jgi:hypothetical protein